jgi:hypothetical protein
MEYHRKGGSEKHLRDIAGILKITGEQIDLAYIDEWAAFLELSEIWGKGSQESGFGLGPP